MLGEEEGWQRERDRRSRKIEIVFTLKASVRFVLALMGRQRNSFRQAVSDDLSIGRRAIYSPAVRGCAALGNERACTRARLQNSKLWKIARARTNSAQRRPGDIPASRGGVPRARETGREDTPSVSVPLEIRSGSAFFQHLFDSCRPHRGASRAAASPIFTTDGAPRPRARASLIKAAEPPRGRVNCARGLGAPPRSRAAQ